MKRTKDGVVLYTLHDMAGALGLPYSTLWGRIVAGAWPEPTVSHGRWRYYEAGDFAILADVGKAEGQRLLEYASAQR